MQRKPHCGQWKCRPPAAAGRAWLRCAVLAAAFAAAGPGRADTVELRNGSTLEGLIVRTNLQEVVLDFGAGEITLRRAQIQTLTRSSEADNGRIKSGWQGKYFAKASYAPERFHALAERFQRLQDERAAALELHRRAGTLAVENDRLRADLRSLQSEWVAGAARGTPPSVPSAADAPPERVRAYNAEVAAYNAAVGRQNQLQSALAAKSAALEENARQQEAGRRGILGYLDAWLDFQQQFERAAGDTNGVAPLAAAEGGFLSRLRSELAGYAGEVQRIRLPCEPAGDHAVLAVRINNRVEARLLLDTGSTSVVLSRAVAARLGLDVAQAPTVPATLADGRKVEAKAFVLDSVQTGDATVERVGALVMDRPPGEGVDGLLGMTFLRHFLLRYQPGSSGVELVRLAPER